MEQPMRAQFVDLGQRQLDEDARLLSQENAQIAMDMHMGGLEVRLERVEQSRFHELALASFFGALVGASAVLVFLHP